jgi:hypothetical protein
MLIIFLPTRHYETTTTTTTTTTVLMCCAVITCWCLIFWYMHADSIPAKQIINEGTTQELTALTAV